MRGARAWTLPQPGWHTGEHLWAANTRVVGQVRPQAIQGMEDAPAESGLQEAIQYMKQEVDDAQRIAQMMEVIPERAPLHSVLVSCLCHQQTMPEQTPPPGKRVLGQEASYS